MNRNIKNIISKFLYIIPDKTYLSLRYFLVFKKRLNWKDPQTFSEKLQWLKLYDRKPEYTLMVDKYEVKNYVRNIIGDKYIIPTLGVWDKPEDIQWDQLPERFVLKTTADGNGNGVIICKDKSKIDKKAVIKKLKTSLHSDIYAAGREWPYKNVKRRIIAEEYLEEKNGELKDYKIFNFDGEPKLVQLDYNRFQGHLRNLYSTDWEKISATIQYPSDESKQFSKPQVLEELKELCKKLSAGIPHVRSDFYIVDNEIYFGELTFFHGSGFEKITPEEFNKQLGDWLILPLKILWGGVIIWQLNRIYLLLFNLDEKNYQKFPITNSFVLTANRNIVKLSRDEAVRCA